MSVGRPQLALVAAGDVSFTSREEALSVDGDWEYIQGGKKHVRAGRWEVGGREREEEGCFQLRWMVCIGAGRIQPSDRQKLRGVGATYADNQARISPASTARTLSR